MRGGTYVVFYYLGTCGTSQILVIRLTNRLYQILLAMRLQEMEGNIAIHLKRAYTIYTLWIIHLNVFRMLSRDIMFDLLYEWTHIRLE